MCERADEGTEERYTPDAQSRSDGQRYINVLADTVTKNSEALDRALLTLSSAFLALSVTFLDKVVKLTECHHLWLLITSWGLFGASIVLNLLAIFVANRECDSRRRLAEKFYFQGQTAAGQQLRDMGSATEWFNYLSAGAYIIATVSIITFVSLNVIRKGGVS